MSNDGWRLSDESKKAKIKYHCMNCEYYMGKEHNFEDCYKSNNGIYMICTREMCNIYPIIIKEEEE